MLTLNIIWFENRHMGIPEVIGRINQINHRFMITVLKFILLYYFLNVHNTRWFYLQSQKIACDS